jgi:hypothetical protein
MVIEIELIPDLIVNSVGDANGARLGESLEAGGDVDAIAEDVAAVDDHVAEIDTDPEFETRKTWDASVVWRKTCRRLLFGLSRAAQNADPRRGATKKRDEIAA